MLAQLMNESPGPSSRSGTQRSRSHFADRFRFIRIGFITSAEPDNPRAIVRFGGCDKSDPYAPGRSAHGCCVSAWERACKLRNLKQVRVRLKMSVQ
jgi:hypothetical protein